MGKSGDMKLKPGSKIFRVSCVVGAVCAFKNVYEKVHVSAKLASFDGLRTNEFRLSEECGLFVLCLCFVIRVIRVNGDG